jgi:Family of unknown function (DUF5681)
MSDVKVNPSRWVKGQSGNPAGKPVGTRNAFSAVFIGDLTASWAEHGATVLERVAKSDPARYLGVASSLIPRDVQLSIEARQSPLDDNDLAVLRAIKESIPNVGELSPQEVFTHTLNALHAFAAVTIEST